MESPPHLNRIGTKTGDDSKQCALLVKTLPWSVMGLREIQFQAVRQEQQLSGCRVERERGLEVFPGLRRATVPAFAPLYTSHHFVPVPGMSTLKEGSWIWPHRVLNSHAGPVTIGPVVHSTSWPMSVVEEVCLHYGSQAAKEEGLMSHRAFGKNSCNDFRFLPQCTMGRQPSH